MTPGERYSHFITKNISRIVYLHTERTKVQIDWNILENSINNWHFFLRLLLSDEYAQWVRVINFSLAKQTASGNTIQILGLKLNSVLKGISGDQSCGQGYFSIRGIYFASSSIQNKRFFFHISSYQRINKFLNFRKLTLFFLVK